MAISVISSFTIWFGTGLELGGPFILIGCWLIASFFSILVGLSLAEICSSYPSAGSVYHWATMLASKRWSALTSYICGWFNLLGNAAGDASFSNGFASLEAASDSFRRNDGTVWFNY